MIKNLIPLLLFLIISETVMAQQFLSYQFYEQYENYKEESIAERRIKHPQILELLDKLKESKNFNVEQIGSSIDGRAINMVKYGHGKIKVLLWSQMHGDEPTATMALFDIFKFLDNKDHFDDFRKKLKSKLTLYFIPMLNPDGAEKYERENAVFIDLNRDAIRLQSPESKALKAVRDSVKPEFGFNLHDQLTRYAAGKNFKQATITFLAPPFNYERDMNEVREKTMKLIVNMHDELSNFIPGHIGKWSDEFEPRAFGDNMVKWGTSSVLIESGGWKDDKEKQFIRKLNFVALLDAFHSIADRIYESADIETYNKIPENDKLIYDVVIRNASYKYKGNNYVLDIAIQNDEKEIKGSSNFYYESSIEDIGDLSVFYGLHELGCEGMKIEEGKILSDTLSSLADVKKLNFSELYSKGITSVILNNINSNNRFTEYPINIYADKKLKSKFGLGENPELVIKKDGKVKYVVINGFICDMETGENAIQNGIIYK